jgi:hypothetical protein
VEKNRSVAGNFRQAHSDPPFSEAWRKRLRRGRSPDSQVITVSATFPFPKEQWCFLADPLAAHSGATVRDFHPLPFSPAVAGEHLGTVTIDITPRSPQSNFHAGVRLG